MKNFSFILILLLFFSNLPVNGTTEFVVGKLTHAEEQCFVATIGKPPIKAVLDGFKTVYEDNNIFYYKDGGMVTQTVVDGLVNSVTFTNFDPTLFYNRVDFKLKFLLVSYETRDIVVEDYRTMNLMKTTMDIIVYESDEYCVEIEVRPAFTKDAVPYTKRSIKYTRN